MPIPAPLNSTVAYHQRVTFTQLRNPIRLAIATTKRRAPSQSKATTQYQAGEPVPDFVVGIDLGTTNSAVAVVENGSPAVIPNALGAQTTPSFVLSQRGGQTLVGEQAKRLASLHPGNTYYSAKRFIGQHFEDVQQDAELVSYKVLGDEDGDVAFGCSANDEGQLYPEEVSGLIVRELLDAAEAHLGAEVTKAVISVPAYFSAEQREATVTAGKIAGLETVRLIREPVAAALAYGVGAEEDQTVLVFDLGGGTFDVSILEVGGGTIEVLSTGGDPHLGGDDWDDAVVQWLHQNYLAPAGIDYQQDPALKLKLKLIAEAAKVKLSEVEKVGIRMPVGGAGGAGVQAVLTRQELEALALPLFRRARLPLDQACWQRSASMTNNLYSHLCPDMIPGCPALPYLIVTLPHMASHSESNRALARHAGVDLGTALADHDTQRGRGKPRARKAVSAAGPQIRPKRRAPISQVLLVGGATRMPAVQRFVQNMTGLTPKGFVVDPDEAVALGAAVMAGILQGQVSDVMVMDIWQASLMRAFATRQLQEDPALLAQQPASGLSEQKGLLPQQPELEQQTDEEEWGPDNLLDSDIAYEST